MELRKIKSKRTRGVWDQGHPGYLNTIEPSPITLSKVAEDIPMYVCPNCKYTMANQ